MNTIVSQQTQTNFYETSIHTAMLQNWCNTSCSTLYTVPSPIMKHVLTTTSKAALRFVPSRTHDVRSHEETIAKIG